MKKVHIWLFITKLLLFSNWAYTQDLVEKLIVIDSVHQKRDKKPYTIRFGLDLSKPLKTQFENNYFGLELVGDIRLYKEIYGAVELGNEQITKQSEQINFTTSGTYIKIGFDYNMYKNWKGMNNAIFLGMRFCNSFHKQEVNEYEIYQLTHYWSEEPISKGPEIGERDQLKAGWIEIVAGMKVRVFNNFYMGFSLRLNRLLSNTSPRNFDNLYIPGFNKKTDENVWGAGFNYTLTYAIPIKI